MAKLRVDVKIQEICRCLQRHTLLLENICNRIQRTPFSKDTVSSRMRFNISETLRRCSEDAPIDDFGNFRRINALKSPNFNRL